MSLNQDYIICNDTGLRIIIIKSSHSHIRLSYATTNIIGICHLSYFASDNLWALGLYLLEVRTITSPDEV